MMQTYELCGCRKTDRESRKGREEGGSRRRRGRERLRKEDERATAVDTWSKEKYRKRELGE